jgi:hypothetical protein
MYDVLEWVDILRRYSYGYGCCLRFINHTDMDAKEIDVFESLKVEYAQRNVSKVTAKNALIIYNKYNEAKIEDCMCSKIKRMILSKDFLQWYEG